MESDDASEKTDSEDKESEVEQIEVPVMWLNAEFRPTGREKAVWGDRLGFKDGDMVMETLPVKGGKIIEASDDSEEEFDTYVVE